MKWNFGTASDTGKLYVFGSSGYYAYHEMEFALWRQSTIACMRKSIAVITSPTTRQVTQLRSSTTESCFTH